MSASTFFEFWSRSAVIAAITFGVCFALLLIDSLIRRKPAVNGKDAENTYLLFEESSKLNGRLSKSIPRAIRTSALIAVVLFVSLSSGSFRRAFTDASSFDLIQMLWHSVASVFNLTMLLLINNILAGNSWRELVLFKRGFPLSRFILPITIALGTHFITPTLYSLFGCLDSWTGIDYSKNQFYLSYGVGGIVLFFFVQQVCFFINGVDEESSWRGFTNAVFSKEDQHPVVMYIISGWIYAMCHALNGGDVSKNLPEYSIIVFNLTCEGAAWMFLYRSTRDLPGNWILHDIDDILSIWIGPPGLAGYALPAGQIAPYVVGCQDRPYLSGGVFDSGGSFVYIGQNIYTLAVILIYGLIARRRKRGLILTEISTEVCFLLLAHSDDTNCKYYSDIKVSLGQS